MLTSSSLTPAGAQGAALETEIKATYLVKFAGFIEWPSRLFAGPQSPLVLCIVGPDPFGSLLAEAATGESAGEHPITVRRLPSAAAVSGCQIVFAGGSADEVAAALAAVAGKPILTVTDLPQATPIKGIINFAVRQGHVRFEIDNRAARHEGLRIDSQLLALAVP